MKFYDKNLLKSLVGKTISEIAITNEKLILTLEYKWQEPKISYVFYSGAGDCGSEVYLADIYGGLKDLIGSPILTVKVSTSNDKPTDEEERKPEKYRFQEEHTWTFLKISTIKGFVTFRWLGTSNGDYSEEVIVEKVTCELLNNGQGNNESDMELREGVK